jgi:hypothetical protein
MLDQVTSSTLGRQLMLDQVTSSTLGRQLMLDQVTSSTLGRQLMLDQVTSSTVGRELMLNQVTSSNQAASSDQSNQVTLSNHVTLSTSLPPKDDKLMLALGSTLRCVWDQTVPLSDSDEDEDTDEEAGGEGVRGRRGHPQREGAAARERRGGERGMLAEEELVQRLSRLAVGLVECGSIFTIIGLFCLYIRSLFTESAKLSVTHSCRFQSDQARLYCRENTF